MNFASIISILFSLFSVSEPIQLEIIYESQVRQTFTEEERKDFSNDELGRAQRNANENPPTETYKMLISANESSFTYQDRIFNAQDQVFDIRYTPAGRGTTYKNLKDSIIIKDVGEIYGKTYFSLDELPKWNWTITSETKDILNQKVIKATSEDENAFYTAWFCPNLTISHGPAEFWGLSGLILEVEKTLKDREHSVSYKVISIKKLKKSPKIIIPNKGIQIKQSDIDGLYEAGRKKRQEILAQEIESD